MSPARASTTLSVNQRSHGHHGGVTGLGDRSQRLSDVRVRWRQFNALKGGGEREGANATRRTLEPMCANRAVAGCIVDQPGRFGRALLKEQGEHLADQIPVAKGLPGEVFAIKDAEVGGV